MSHYHSTQFFLPFYWSRAPHVTCKWLPTDKGLLMRTVFLLCLATNDILLMRKWNHAFLPLAIAFAWKWQLDSRASRKRKHWGREWSLRFQKIFIKKQTRWSNDKTIIKLSYRKISWFVSVSQLKYLPQPSVSANNWSARHWQITIFCSTSSNNCILIIIIDPWLLSRWRVWPTSSSDSRSQSKDIT